MIRFSASYTNLNNNFCIDNISSCNKMNDKMLAICSIVQNILFRGCPTKPSEFLETNLGNVTPFDNPVYFVSEKKLNWDKVIKGSEKQNPALEFYNNYLIEGLQNDYRLLKTFIPECSFGDIILTDDKVLKNHFADFYSPKLKCAIEIDGAQHNQYQNIQADKERDNILTNNGITVIRIPAREISKKNEELVKLSSKIDLDNYLSKVDKVVNNYNACIRFQALILSMLKTGNLKLDNDWKFKVLDNGQFDKNALDCAVKDTIYWLNSIILLQKNETVNIKYSIELTNSFSNIDDGYIKVDMDLNDRYEQPANDKIIYIRNDYFEYSITANIQYQKNIKEFISTKNYYKVENGAIKYQISDNQRQMNALRYILKNVFFFDDFLPKQSNIIVEALNKGSVIGILPTGAGKSLCYQMTSLLLPGTTIVVSPLKALMEDQYENMLHKYQISNICYINSSSKGGTHLLKYNQSKIVLISPERFFNEEFLEILNSENMQISLVAIDEVHCISEWGHDFRTSYLCLTHYLKDNLSESCRLIGLTATASPRVCEDIENEFANFKGKTRIIQSSSLKRSNLDLKVQAFKFKGLPYVSNTKYQALLSLFKDEALLNEKSVVFTRTKSYKSLTSCQNLTKKLKEDLKIDNISINYYSAGSGIENDINNKIKLRQFKSGETKLLFATKAFGMGIDIPDIRRTIHFGLPSSIESLYQEFGRAGRDRKPAECLIWYYKEDEKEINRLFDNDLSMKFIEDNMNNFNEFSTNLYFVSSGNLDPKNEIYFIIYLYNFLLNKSNDNQDISFYAYEFINTFEEDAFKKQGYREGFEYLKYIDKALYRLYLLGRISIWGVRYDSNLQNPHFVNIRLTNITLEEQIKNVTKYIKKYEPNYVYDKVKNGIHGRNILLEFVDWMFNHFVYQSVQSIKNVYELCTQYKNSDQLMTSIERYLAHDEKYEGLILDINNYDLWFELLKETPMIELKAVISRYLESDDKLVSLNFISGIIRLLTDDFDNADGERRLKMAFETIATFKEDDIENIISKALNYISHKKYTDQFVHTALSVNSKFANVIYKYYQNDELDCEIVLYLAEKISSIGGMINDKFRKN